jgi:hypothetical protein
MSKPLNKIAVQSSLDSRLWIKKNFYEWTTSGAFYDCFLSASIKQDDLTRQDMGEMSKPVNKVTVQHCLDQIFWIKENFMDGPQVMHFMTVSFHQVSNKMIWLGKTWGKCPNLFMKSLSYAVCEPLNKITLQSSLDSRLWIKTTFMDGPQVVHFMTVSFQQVSNKMI